MNVIYLRAPGPGHMLSQKNVVKDVIVVGTHLRVITALIVSWTVVTRDS